MAQPARTSDSALTPIEKARLVLQEGIAQHTETILDMKHRLNSLAPTARLPPELLAEIFIHLSRDQSITYPTPLPPLPPNLNGLRRKEPAPHFRPYAWLTATHVCHHWRTVALSAPQLWSTVWVTGVECVTEILARSRQVPLTVKADSLVRRVDSLDVIMEELPRIVSFDVKTPPHLPKREYGVEAPRLKELVLKCSGTYEMLTLGTSQLQSHFASCDIPFLESLELHSFNIQWENKLFKPTLKHLTLHGMKSIRAIQIEDVLRALESLPLLETLDVSSCLPVPPGYIGEALPEPTHVVELPHLRKLGVFSTASSCAYFLRHISFPPDVTMTLNCQIYTPVEAQVLFPAILEKLTQNTMQPRVLRTLAFQSLMHGGITQLRAWSSFHGADQLANETKTALPQPFLDLSIRHNMPFGPLSLFRAIPTADVESILLRHVHSTRRMDKSEWTGTFAKLTQLRELSLDYWAQDHVHQILDHKIPCLEEPTGAKKSRKRKQFAMPNLEVLYLTDMEVMPKSERSDGKDVFLTRLQRSLSARQKQYGSLPRLVLRACPNLSEEDAEVFEQSVDEVEWYPTSSGSMAPYPEEDIAEDYEITFGPHGGFPGALFGLEPFLAFPEFEDEFSDSDDDEDFW